MIIVIEDVYIWCAEQDIIIAFNARESSYDSESEVIYLESYDSPQEELFSLLHECGHYLVQNSDNYHILYRDKIRPLNDCEYVAGLLREERAAWAAGLHLAQKLNIPLDIDAYNALASNCLEQYEESVLLFWEQKAKESA